MYFNSSFRFRTKKVVGSPSAEGNGQHTIASHIGDADPHPNYLLKGEESRPFDISEHLAAVLDHAVGYIRRGEVAEGKRDYLQNRFLSLINDPNNYGALLQAKRHVITAYVLNQVLEDFGLVDDVKLENYVLRDHIVTSESGAPETDQEEYVVGWVLYKNLLTKYANLNTAAQTWVTKTEANNFSRITHTHKWADIENITGSTFATKTEVDEMFTDFLERLNDTVGTALAEMDEQITVIAAKLGYVLTGDSVFKPGTSYYTFNGTTKTFDLKTAGTDYTLGAAITANTYWTRPTTVGSFIPNWGSGHTFEFPAVDSSSPVTSVDTALTGTANYTGTVIMNVHLGVTQNTTRVRLLVAMPDSSTYTEIGEFITVHSYGYGEYNFMHVDIQMTTRAIAGTKFRLEAYGDSGDNKITSIFYQKSTVFEDYT